MKLSIRYKLLFYMLVSVLVFSVLLIISNTFLVERYYLERTKRELLTTGNEVVKIIENVNYDPEHDTLKLESSKWEELLLLERVKGQSLLIQGQGGNIFYPIYLSSLTSTAVVGAADSAAAEAVESSEERQSMMIIQTAPKLNLQVESDAEPSEDEVLFSVAVSSTINDGSYNQTISEEEDGSIFLLSDDSSLKVRNLSYQKQLDNGLILQVSTPMSVISEGIAISNQFSTIIGLITILFTVLWSMFISHRFTNPIKSMNQITDQMAKLDFKEKIEASGNDEIAQLAGNINELSDRLDVTIGELNIRNQKLEEEVDKERKIDKMRRDFISSVSHELKTPIFLIQGYADGLRRNITKDQEQKDFYCDVIIEESDKMNLIVKDLLSIAKHESSGVTICCESFDLNEFIRMVLEKYRITAENRQIRLESELKEQLTVCADPFKIEQVLTNFINNAIEYANGEKVIKIEAGRQSDDKVRICVSNTGEPLSEEQQTLVWNSFYKADPSRSRSIGGAGLGLSIVKTIMDAHNQKFGTDNIDGGVVFWFELDLE